MITNQIERVLEFSRTYFSAFESRESAKERSSSAKMARWPGSQRDGQSTGLGTGGRIEAWRDWRSRGIPELALPLAD